MMQVRLITRSVQYYFRLFRMYRKPGDILIHCPRTAFVIGQLKANNEILQIFQQHCNRHLLYMKTITN